MEFLTLARQESAVNESAYPSSTGGRQIRSLQIPDAQELETPCIQQDCQVGCSDGAVIIQIRLRVRRLPYVQQDRKIGGVDKAIVVEICRTAFACVCHAVAVRVSACCAGALP